jgi:hypothetical protein
MSYFLWVEDFENSPKITATEVLGGINIDEQQFSDNKQELKKNLKTQGIYIELSFQDGLGFIRQNLGKIDYIILDIDLAAYSKGDVINDEVLELLETFQDYKKPVDETEEEQLLGQECAKLKALAGYYLYTELVVELGFPKQHILFCSNHGENSLSTRDAFKTAKIALPTIYEKSHSEVQAWVKSCYENPYARLRRGIIEGCQFIKTLNEDKLRFKDFINEPEKKVGFEDILDYVKVLENFLPLYEPTDKATWYKLFIRTLSHEWEAAEPKQLNKQNKQNGVYAFSWIMKMSRNWLAHGKAFEQLTASDVAYLFIVNMRAMFDLVDKLLPYEKHLLSLFSKIISMDELKEVTGSYHGDRKIPLIQSYAALLHTSGNRWEVVNYHDALNQFQRSKTEKSLEDISFLRTGLYQAFWFLTSNGFVSLPTDADKNLDTDKLDGYKALNYQFGFFDYKKSDFLLEFSRHIYSRSFLSGEKS